MNEQFKNTHRYSSKDFTRDRKLPFHLLICLVIQKGIKSIQLRLNELFLQYDLAETISASAFSQARNKLSYTAFIELQQIGIVEPFYKDGDHKTYKGYRLLGIDGSKIRLPDEEKIRDVFGTINIANQDPRTVGKYPSAMASVLYDVLNGIALHAIIAHAKAYEVNLAIEHLAHTRDKDMILFDRNYPSYYFLSTLISLGLDFTGRCSMSSFSEARTMFKDEIESKTVLLRPHHTKKKEIEEKGLPSEIKVRFVRVVLDTGEAEVLVTSLLDEELFPSKEFKELYHLRWGIETFYGVIKERLILENFTGKSVEAIKQDFYSTIFLSSLETVLTAKAQEELENKPSENKHPQTVNKAVSFNAIKNQALGLFYKEDNIELILGKLTNLFLTNPNSVRNERFVARKKTSNRTLLNYHKRIKKVCF